MRKVRPTNNCGVIRFRFTHQGKRYSLSTGGVYGDPIDMAFANAIAAKIMLDMRAGHFDQSLQRYKTLENAPAPQRNRALLTVWDQWVETLGLSEETKADHYAMVRRMIQRRRPSADENGWFIKMGEKLASSTYNKRLGYLKRCLDWAIAQGMVSANPYNSVKTRQGQPEPVKPFTQGEVNRILEGFKRLHPAYVPFVGFLLATGCRTSEAIGLQWKRIDFERSEITIADSTPKKKAGSGTQRKGTKTGRVTVLGMNDDLRQLLGAIPPREPEELVFRSPEGKTIDRYNFRGAWVEVLKSENVPYRKPYTTRHTTASHALDQGASLPSVAYILGHRDTRMVSQNYGHLIDRPALPKVLPSPDDP